MNFHNKHEVIDGAVSGSPHTTESCPILIDPTAEITATLRQVSPRFQHPVVAARSMLIYGAVFAVWVGVLVGAWFAQGISPAVSLDMPSIGVVICNPFLDSPLFCCWRCSRR